MALAALIVAFAMDREKAKQSLKMSAKAFMRIIPAILTITLIIGLTLGFLTSEDISGFIGDQSGIGGVLLIGALGALLYIPALIAFPLGGSLLDNGASVTAVAAFITTLTMVGTITLPIEIKELGKRMALLRNGLSFIVALIIAVVMGAIL